MGVLMVNGYAVRSGDVAVTRRGELVVSLTNLLRGQSSHPYVGCLVGDDVSSQTFYDLSELEIVGDIRGSEWEMPYPRESPLAPLHPDTWVLQI